MSSRSTILKPLPDQFNQGLGGGDVMDNGAHKQFFEERVSQCDRREVADEFKRTLVLEAQKSRKKQVNKPRVSKKMLTAREKRELGLHRLPKIGLQYEQFKDLHELWSGYMKELLDMENLKQSGWRPDNLEEPRLQQLQMKICRADFHGAIIKVTFLLGQGASNAHSTFLW